MLGPMFPSPLQQCGRFLSSLRWVSSHSSSRRTPLHLHALHILPAVDSISRPPVVILHGLLGNALNWKPLITDHGLCSDREVFLVDLRNHGRSPHSPSMSYLDMASDIVSFLDSRHIDKAVLLGHSMGGKVAMSIALEHPDRVSDLIVADISPVDYTGNEKWTIPRVFSGIRAIDLSSLCEDIWNEEMCYSDENFRLRSRRDADDVLKGFIKESRVRQFVLSNLITEMEKDADGSPRLHFSWRSNTSVLESCLEEIGGFPSEFHRSRYDHPCLFLGGRESLHMTESLNYHTIFRYFPYAVVEFIDGAGHWVHAEKPEEFTEHVHGYLNRHQT